jgi:hypothetical protein
MIRFCSSWFPICIIALCFISKTTLNVKLAEADTLDDFYIEQAIDRYFALPRDGKTLSLGGTPASVCDGSQCVFLNPGGLGFVRELEITSSIGNGRISGDEFLEDQEIRQHHNEGYIAAAIPLGGTESGVPHYGVLTFAYSRYAGDTNDSINTTPDGHRRTIGYSFAPSATWSLGYVFTFFDDQLRTDLSDLHSHARMMHVLGIQNAISDTLSWGVVMKYGLGQSDTEEFAVMSNGLSKPRQYTLSGGIRQRFYSAQLYASVDFSILDSQGNLNNVNSPAVVVGSDEDGNLTNARLGSEYPIFDRIPLRFGFRYQYVDYSFKRSDLASLTGNSSGVAISTGIGVMLGKDNSQSQQPRLDFGVEYSVIGHGNWQSILSLSVPL